MHSLQGTKDFCTAPLEQLSPLPCKNTGSKNSEQTKIEEKTLEKSRSPSANSTSAVKPPYSYIALSNYHFLYLTLRA